MELKDGTYRYYKAYVQTHIVPALGHLKLQRVNDTHLQSFYRSVIGEEDTQGKEPITEHDPFDPQRPK